MAQKYLPEVRTGDKRIILLDGEPIGAVLRVPREDETRSNLHVGGRAAHTDLDERDTRDLRRARRPGCAPTGSSSSASTSSAACSPR